MADQAEYRIARAVRRVDELRGDLLPSPKASKLRRIGQSQPRRQPRTLGKLDQARDCDWTTTARMDDGPAHERPVPGCDRPGDPTRVAAARAAARGGLPPA